MAEPFAGRIILVTGASRGLGRAAALAAGGQGAHIVATARTQGALEALDDEIRAAGGRCTLLPLDLLQKDGIERLGPSIYKRFGRLDAFIHAAGELGPLTPTHQLKTADLRRILELHALAAQRLIITTDPLLRAAPKGQAVFITDSLATAAPKPFWCAYQTAKQALAAIIACYRLETAKTSIEIHEYDPQPMQTVLRRAAFPGEPDKANPSPEGAARRIIEILADHWHDPGLPNPRNSD